MIYDSLEAIDRYRGLSKGLDEAIDWLATCDLAALEVGCHRIDGDRVFANVQDPTTRLAADAHFEVHARYMDLQFDLAGHEEFGVTCGKTVEVGPFDAEADFGLLDAADSADPCVTRASLEGGRFVVFMCGEPHMPNLAPADDPQPIKKVCVKILRDDLWDE